MSDNQISNSGSADPAMASADKAAADSPLPNRAAAATKICKGCGATFAKGKLSPSTFKKRKFCMRRCYIKATWYD